MSTTLYSNPIVERLAEAGASRIFTPDQPEFRSELSGFNLAVQHHPDVVVAATSISDVLAAVTVAAELDLPVTVVGHGHGVRHPADGGVAVTTRGLNGVEIDPSARTARIGAGTDWTAVLEASARHGLAPLCGSAPHVGVVGYLLGGGSGPVGRTYGFAADHVHSFRVVTAEAGWSPPTRTTSPTCSGPCAEARVDSASWSR